jgi:ABC-type bacteriocin/lantibiotic exporter with double-glycine peptidase domain
MKGRTSIIIAHRLSAIQRVNRIIVQHKREITGQGTRQELLKKRGSTTSSTSYSIRSRKANRLLQAPGGESEAQ